MKKNIYLLLVTLILIGITGCSNNNSNEIEMPIDESLKIAIAIYSDKVDDGINKSIYDGAKTFAEANGYTYKYYAMKSDRDLTEEDYISNMWLAIANGAEIVVVPNSIQTNALKRVAEEATEVKFIFVDGCDVKLDNVTTIRYSEEEAGYLAGYAAVKDGYTKLGGTFDGSGTNEIYNGYCYGYLQGINAAAKELNTTVDVVISFLYGNDYNKSEELEAQVSNWYKKGIEIVFSCGETMIKPIINATSKMEKAMIIGVDVDQSNLSDRIITSTCKNLKNEVEKTLEIWNEGNWDTQLANKITEYSIVDDGVYLPTNKESWKFNSFTVEEYNTIYNKIATGEIKIDKSCLDLSGTSDNQNWTIVKENYKNINLKIEY